MHLVIAETLISVTAEYVNATDVILSQTIMAITSVHSIQLQSNVSQFP